MASEGLSERGRAWQERIEHQQSIGLSITEYCEVVGVSTASFYQCKRPAHPWVILAGNRRTSGDFGSLQTPLLPAFPFAGRLAT